MLGCGVSPMAIADADIAGMGTRCGKSVLASRSRRCSSRHLFLLLVMLALLAFCIPLRAYAVESPSTSGGSTNRTDAALEACLNGLLEGFGMSDAASLYASDMMDVKDGLSAWIAFDMYRAGLTDGAEAYRARSEEHVTKSYAGADAGLDSRAPTTWARTAIVAKTLGADPTAFGKASDGKPANLLSDGLYNWAYTDSLGTQGSNAYIFALQAIDSCGVKVPSDAAYSTQDMIDGLLACQAEEGSFALSPGSTTGSVDLTGMALAALSAHASDPAVADSIKLAISYLATQQLDTGGFAAEGEETSETCAMVIIGLVACGVDPVSDTRFIKNGRTMVDALLSFQKENGTFGHSAKDVAITKVQGLPTEQALRALLAIDDAAQGGDGNVYTADVALAIPGVSTRADSAVGAQSGNGSSLAHDWGIRLKWMGVGVAAALVVIALIWVARKVHRNRRRVRG